MAIAVAAGLHGGSGLTASLAGWAVGLGLFIPFFLLGGMGAGDVKLLAAVGAWLGVPGVVWAALYGALCGGVLALFLSVRQGYVLSAFKNIWLLLTHWRVAGLGPVAGVTLADGTGPKLPYAIPIALGAGLALWLR